MPTSWYPEVDIKSFYPMSTTLLAVVFIFTIFLTSCQDAPPSPDRLLGTWKVVSAARNGRETRTLEDGFFSFDSDTTFETNIFSSVEKFKYQLTDKGFKQLGGESLDYIIEKSQKDSLVLRTLIRDHEFLFITVKDTSIESSQEQ